MNPQFSSLLRAGAFVLLAGFSLPAQSANISNGQSIFQSKCQGCHGSSPDASRLRCASKVFIDTLGNHYGNALLNVSDSDKTDLAAFIASKDPSTYSFSGTVTNSGGGMAGVSIVAAGFYQPNVTNTTAANGTFTLNGLRAGDYTVTASKTALVFNPASYLVGLATNVATQGKIGSSTNRIPVSTVVVNYTFTTDTQPNFTLSPADGTTYSAPAVIAISASVYDPDSTNGSVAQLKLYNGTTLLQGATGGAANPLYFLNYNLNAGTPGIYTLTAVALDYQGAFTTSAPVNITITEPVPPPNGISLTAGKLVYDNNCSYCHGTPPGGNGGSPFFGLNPIPLYAASRAVIKPGLVFSQGYVKSVSLWYDHAAATVGSSYAHGVSSYPPVSVSNYVNNIMTSDEQSNLAAYIASQNQTYWSFGGFVKNINGQGIAGATVTLSSTYNPGATATTDANGIYLFGGLRQGDYTVSVSHISYPNFYPASHDLKASSSSAPSYVSLDGGNVSSTVPSVDFTSVFSVSGSVTNTNGRGFSGVTVRAQQSATIVASAVTDANGNYTLPLTNGSYTISAAAITQYAFTPATRSVTVNADQLGISFGVTSYPPLVISGTIRGSTNQAMAGVTVALNEAPSVTGITDASGRYSLTNSDPGTFTVTPVFGSYAFTPSSIVTTISTSNQTNINFTGFLNSYTINGLVRAPGFFGIVGATVSIAGQSVTTSSIGAYALVVTNGTYILTVSKPGFIFNPTNQTVIVNNGTLYGVNFTAYLPITYVAPFGRNANDGSSWSSAKSSVQAAINATVPGGQVWVAASRYYELISFNGISLYGGFAGNESALEQRNWVANLTSIDGNQIVFGQIGKLPGTIVSGSGRLDGFEIVNGLNYTDQNQNYQSQGGGVSFSGIIVNNVIHGNKSSSTGGGVYCGDNGSIISNNTIYGNSTSFKGAGIFSGASQVTIVNNVVYGNQCANLSGGIHVDYGSLGTVVANNIVAGNYAANYSAGIGMFSISGLVVNNTVVGNVLTNNIDGAAGIYFGWGSSTNVNNIVAFNTGGLYKDPSATALLSNTCVFGNTVFTYSNLVASSSDIAVDPQFVNRAGGDYHLLATSPAIDAGNNSFVLGSTDNDGEPRIQGARVDLGADEYSAANVLPAVSITTPAPGSTYRDPATFTISASATDSDGSITQIVFFVGSTPLGTNTSSPFSLIVSNFGAGSYSLTASATDNRGGTKISSAVSVAVYSPTAPTISITSPTNGIAFPGPANILVSANAQGNSGSVTQVLFYAGVTLIGSKTSQPYSITWSNAVEGMYYLTAVAKDNQGLTATSSAIIISVINPPSFTRGSDFQSGQFRLPILIEAGQRYAIQASTNLINWTSLVTNQSTGGPYEFIDTQTTNIVRRFYRVLVVP